MLTLIVGDDEEEGGILFDFFDIMQAFIFNCIKYGKEQFIANHFEELMKSISRIIEISSGISREMKEGIISLKII